MTPELSLAWGALLIDQGNGEQLQLDKVDTVLDAHFMTLTLPNRWRRKPKTRTLTVWTWKSQEGFYHTRNSDECTAPMLNAEIFDTHTIDVEA